MSNTKENAYEILERVTDGFFALDVNWNFTYVNSAAARLLFRKRDNLVGKNIWSEFPEAIELVFYNHYHRAIREQKPVLFEAYFPQLNMWFEVKAYPSLNGLSVYFQDISDRKLSQTQKDEHYKSLFEQNPDAVYSFDLNGNYLSVNPVMERMFGYTESELLQMSFVPLVSKVDLDRVMEHYKRATEGITQRYQVKTLHKNGTVVYLNVTNMPIIINGKIVGVYGIAKDITDRQLEQDELSKTKERLESFVHNNADAIWVIDLEDRVLEINSSFETMFGYSAESIIGKTLPIVPDFLNDFIQEIHNKVRTGVSVVALETIRECMDGSLIHVSATLSPIVDLKGNVTGITGVCRNITSRKKAEETVKIKSKQLESYIENNVDGILIFNRNGDVVHSNKAYETMFGWTGEEIQGVHLYDLGFIPDEILTEVKRFEGKVKQGMVIFGEETIRVRKDGVKVNVILSAAPIHDAQGNLDGWSSTLRDITEWKMSQIMLQNTEKLSVAGQLAAGIAHEIRNPITSIKGFIYLMKNGFGDKEEYFKVMSSECERIEGILSELLILAKPQINKLEQTDIHMLLTQIIVLLKTEAIMNNVEIITEFLKEDLQINCDENQMKQVFINFIKNAIEAMKKGGNLTIQTQKRDEKKLMIQIIDEGGGMSEETISKLGQPFYTTKQKGTGLGFMISKKIIDNHFGEVHIESEVNKGTTIEVIIPLVNEKANLLN
ncbi:PAS domain S-box protein [Gottfriedia sp. NPDC058432]|uniref:PAS domain S-box protein n=1 Tax=Gottfriedia sp. NPDC058432 TaxID=3346497 RepID=UPI003663E05D